MAIRPPLPTSGRIALIEPTTDDIQYSYSAHIGPTGGWPGDILRVKGAVLLYETTEVE